MSSSPPPSKPPHNNNINKNKNKNKKKKKKKKHNSNSSNSSNSSKSSQSNQRPTRLHVHRVTGVIKFFSAPKEFGFIHHLHLPAANSATTNQDLPPLPREVHFSTKSERLVAGSFLQRGQPVVFDLSYSPGKSKRKRWAAYRVRVDGSTATVPSSSDVVLRARDLIEHMRTLWVTQDLADLSADVFNQPQVWRWLCAGDWDAFGLSTLPQHPHSTSMLTLLLLRLLTRSDLTRSSEKWAVDLFAMLLQGKRLFLQTWLPQLLRQGSDNEDLLARSVQLCKRLVMLFPDQKSLVDGTLEAVELRALRAKDQELLATLQSISDLPSRAADADLNEAPVEFTRFPSPAVLASPVARYLAQVPSLHEPKSPRSYPSMRQLLDTHVQLLGADCFADIVEGLEQYHRGEHPRRLRNMLRFYRDCSLVGVDSGRAGAGVTLAVRFDPWPHPGRRRLRESYLAYGNLVAVMPGRTPPKSLSSVLWATVAEHSDKLSDNLITHLQFVDQHDDVLSLLEDWGTFCMVECSTLFISVGPVLDALRERFPDDMPFAPELLSAEPGPVPPYLDGVDTQQVIEATTERFTLGPNQASALRLALSRRLAVIQGAPGCGKTRTAAAIARAILTLRRQHGARVNKQLVPLRSKQAELDRRIRQARLRRLSRVEFQKLDAMQRVRDKLHVAMDKIREQRVGPILVITYKNYALDQFLGRVLEDFGDSGISLARMGGGCTDERVGKHHVDKLKMNHDGAKQVYRTRRGVEGEIRELTQQHASAMIDPTDLRCKLSMLGPDLLDLFEQQSEHLIHMAEEEQRRSGFAVAKSKATKKRERSPDYWFFNWINGASRPVSAPTAPLAGGKPACLKIPLDKSVGEHVYVCFPASGRKLQVPYSDDMRTYCITVDLLDAESEAFYFVVDDPAAPSATQVSRLTSTLHPTHEHDDIGTVNTLHEELSGEEEPQHNAEQREQAMQMHHRTERTMFAVSSAQTAPEVVQQCARLERLLLDEIVDFWELAADERALLAEQWRARFAAQSWERAREMMDELQRLSERCIKLRQDERAIVMRDADIVGMTTTGMAMHRGLIDQLQPSVLIVEEAAEILEAQLLACLGPSVQHMILIGDHQQLQPGVQRFELARRNHLDVSLFQSLIESPGFPSVSLQTQRRMRPEISACVRPIYEAQQLQFHDHDSVLSREFITGSASVPGVAHDVFVWTHNFPEDPRSSDKSSSSNSGEAFMVHALAKYLCGANRSLISRERVVVLTPYVGQLRELRRLFTAHPDTAGIKIVTVDRFQGSESDIVLLSLVRNNASHNIGFLRRSNRFCVATSRAKFGFFIVGAADSLQRGNSKYWRSMYQHLAAGGAADSHLPLVCPRHSHSVTRVDWQSIGANADIAPFCAEPCEHQYEPCGHRCERTCHDDSEHIMCPKPCEKLLPCGHGCRDVCGSCCTKRCREPVPTTLACGHDASPPCYQRDTYKCHQACERPLECGHPCTLRCHQACTSIGCPFCAEAIAQAAALREQQLREHFRRLYTSAADAAHSKQVSGASLGQVAEVEQLLGRLLSADVRVERALLITESSGVTAEFYHCLASFHHVLAVDPCDALTELLLLPADGEPPDLAAFACSPWTDPSAPEASFAGRLFTSATPPAGRYRALLGRLGRGKQATSAHSFAPAVNDSAREEVPDVGVAVFVPSPHQFLPTFAVDMVVSGSRGMDDPLLHEVLPAYRYWTAEGKQGSHGLRSVLRGSAEFREVQRAFGDGERITVQRVENLRLLRDYVHRVAQLQDKYADTHGANCRDLFHGCPAAAAPAIVEQGFDMRLAGTKHGVALGCGNYFAVQSAMSRNYTSGATGSRTMFYARVACGAVMHGSGGLKRPEQNGVLLDSTVNSVDNPTVVVTFSNDQSYPAYLITF